MTRAAFRRQMRPVRTKRRRTARDAEDPKSGEIYETRAGNRWEVTNVTDKLVTVKRAGNRSEGPFAWGRSTLKGMKEIRKPLFGSLFSSSKTSEPIAPDPDRRRRRPKKRLARKRKKRGRR